FKISTYGFRGEALSSISAVSKMILSSKTEEEENGTQINVLGGKITNLKDIARTTGTTIEIKDLFYNTPARLKFLRKANTEYSNIKDIIIKEALANSNVRFSLIIDGKESIRTSGNGMDNTVLEIFGKNYLKNSEKFALGYLGNAELFKSNRDSIFVFINGRSVKSKLVEDAVIDAYHTKLMKGKYPFALIFLKINPADIDVNVHPSKKIVKFANNGEIYNAVKNEIDRVFMDDEDFISPHILSNEENINFYREEKEDNKIQEENRSKLLDISEFKKELLNENQKYGNLSQLSSIKREEFVNLKHIDSLDLEEKTNFIEIKEREVRENCSPVFEKSEISKEKNYIFNSEETARGKIFDEFTTLKNIDFKVIGQVFDSFILVERNGILEIYDQHIIHERILYEKLKQEYYNSSMSKQNLLVPIRIALDPREKEIALDNLEIFSSFGFEIDDFEKNEILVRSTPIMDLRDSYENIIKNILENIMKNKNEDIRENIIISMSCKGAIKANHKLKIEEMYSMVAKLHEVGEYTCPHGRPIIVKMSLYDLEKLFKRK
ncbi:MAG: DNA mismatch repair endonuclease MutL, partial [Fusobacterium sp.]|nr:DNA mismatch repair endonuclease MutL [Fusobacterium sp.]